MVGLREVAGFKDPLPRQGATAGYHKTGAVDHRRVGPVAGVAGEQLIQLRAPEVVGSVPGMRLISVRPIRSPADMGLARRIVWEFANLLAEAGSALRYYLKIETRLEEWSGGLGWAMYDDFDEDTDIA